MGALKVISANPTSPVIQEPNMVALGLGLGFGLGVPLCMYSRWRLLGRNPAEPRNRLPATEHLVIARPSTDLPELRGSERLVGQPGGPDLPHEVDNTGIIHKVD